MKRIENEKYMCGFCCEYFDEINIVRLHISIPIYNCIQCDKDYKEWFIKNEAKLKVKPIN